MPFRNSYSNGNRKAIAAVLAVAAITQGFGRSAVAAESTKTVPALKGLHERWAKMAEELDAPGIAVAVVKDDRVVLTDAFGRRGPDSDAAVDLDTMFYIASSTKSFTAMAIMILVDDGKIDLDAPVKTYLPRFKLSDPELTSKITVRDLLCHKYGLNSTLAAFAEAYTGQIDDDKFYRILRQFKPKGFFEYSNLHFTLAGRIIHAVSGMSWKDFIQKRILEPAGMSNSTCYASVMYGGDNHAEPMTDFWGKWQATRLQKTDNTMHAAGGMGASAADLAQWIRLNLNGGQLDGKRILSEKLVREMHTQHAGTDQKFGSFGREGYGLGWFIGSYQDEVMIHHFGGYAGSRAHISFMPARDIGIVVLMNSAGPVSSLADVIACDVYDRLLGKKGEDLLPKIKENVAKFRKLGAETDPNAGDNPVVGDGLSLKPQAYVGQYTSENWGTLEVKLKDGQLVAAIGDIPLTLYSTETDRFITAVQGIRPHDKGRFRVSPSGEVHVVTIEAGDGMTMSFKRP
jgi:CubicO group peptidase (beta-lactamase class C family)